MSRGQHKKRYTEKGLTIAEEQFLWDIKESKTASLPSPAKIVEKAANSVLSGRTGDAVYVKAHFSELISKIESEAHQTYRGAELASSSNALISQFKAQTKSAGSIDDALISIFHDNYPVLNEYFLSLRQSRASRAGDAFENIAVSYTHLTLPTIYSV